MRSKKAKKTNKLKKGPKWKDKKFLLDLLYFVGVLAIAAVLLTYISAIKPDMTYEKELVASHTGTALRAVGVPADVADDVIIIDSLQVRIIPECVGWMGVFAVVALILAYPAVEWKKRMLGLIVFIPLMYFVNILRLTTTIFAGYHYGMDVFDFVHSFLWKTVLIGFALLFWILWLHFIVDEKGFSLRKKPQKKKKGRKRKK
jgi:exosortase/archaeosortase family protein